jgi:hypothetical protein
MCAGIDVAHMHRSSALVGAAADNQRETPGER